MLEKHYTVTSHKIRLQWKQFWIISKVLTRVRPVVTSDYFFIQFCSTPKTTDTEGNTDLQWVKKTFVRFVSGVFDQNRLKRSCFYGLCYLYIGFYLQFSQCCAQIITEKENYIFLEGILCMLNWNGRQYFSKYF